MIKHFLTASILLLVFSLGARATFADATSLFRSWLAPPHRLVRALLAMYVVVPVVAACMGLMLELAGPVRVALLAVAVAPIPPILPGKQLKGGGSRAHAFGLLVAVSLCAVVLVPLTVGILGHLFGMSSSFGPIKVARLIGVTILIPLLAGIALAYFAPALAAKLAPIVSKAGLLLLVVVALLILVSQWRHMAGLVGDGTVLAFVAFVVVGLAVGHALGGPDPSDRTVLALATASRHPGLALAVAHVNYPDAKALVAAVLLFLVVNVIVSIPYVVWRKRAGAAGAVDL